MNASQVMGTWQRYQNKDINGDVLTCYGPVSYTHLDVYKRQVLVTIFGVLVAFVMVFPIVWLLMSSFKDSTELFAYPLHFLPEKFSLDSYASVIKSGFFQYCLLYTSRCV